MLLIHCPRTGSDELVGVDRIRSLVNHPTHIALTVACPCGETHQIRTGRRRHEQRPAAVLAAA
jgi:hypothetical protein